MSMVIRRECFKFKLLQTFRTEPVHFKIEFLRPRLFLPPPLQRLSELVYAPLAKYLTNVSHLIICPDGQLSRLPFEALVST